MGERVTIRLDDGSEMGAYVAHAAGSGPRPGMLLFQEALGVNAQMRGVADRWAAQGYEVVLPDLFHRFAPGYERDELNMAEIRPMVSQLTTEGLEADAVAAHAWLSARPEVANDRIVALGFCMGGRAAYIANSALPLAAAVSYYAGYVHALLDRAERLHGPHAFFWGGKDQSISEDQRRAVIDALRAASKRYVDCSWSDAGHAFFNERASLYVEHAAKESWALAVRFLDNVLGTS